MLNETGGHVLPQNWKDFAEEMRATGAYEESLLNPYKLYDWYLNDRAVAEFGDNERVIRYGARLAMEKDADWAEIALLFRASDYSSRDFYVQTVKDLIAKGPQEQNLFLISKREGIISILRSFNFLRADAESFLDTAFFDAREWAEQIGLSRTRLPESALRPKEAPIPGEHYLFIRFGHKRLAKAA